MSCWRFPKELGVPVRKRCVNATLTVTWILALRPDNKFRSLASLSQTTNIPNHFCQPTHMQKLIQDYLEAAQKRM